MKEQGQLQNCFFSKALSTTFCREVPEPSVWIQCFSLSLEASRQGEGKGGIGRRGRELSLVLATARGNFFSLKNLNYLQIRQTAQHVHEHPCTCTLVSKQPTAIATSPKWLCKEPGQGVHGGRTEKLFTCKRTLRLKEPPSVHPTFRASHSEEQKVIHFFFRTSSDRLWARAITSFQWSKVRLKGVVSHCPISQMATRQTKNSKH